MARSFRPLRLIVAIVVVGVIGIGLAGCVADPPPLIGTAVGGDRVATVSWQPPVAAPQPIVAYVVTPWVGAVAQTPVRFNSTATTQVVTGLTNGVTYTFTVQAINARGDDSAGSGPSNPVTPEGPHIAAAGLYSCAIVAGGAVDCWGLNNFGQLGDGTTTTSSTPVQVIGLTAAVAIDAGPGHTCALLAAGTVECWGANARGALGNGTTTDSSTPVAVTGLTDAVAVSTGAAHGCAVKSNGTVFCWGYNGHGQLGYSGGPSLTPRQVSGLTGATAVTAGWHHTCVLVAGGAGKCWGLSIYGQLGNNSFFGSTGPVAVSGLAGATGIEAGDYHTCAIVTDGAARCWGANAYGQLGNGTNTTCGVDGGECGIPVPVSVIGLTAISAVAGGTRHSCALTADGAGYCWGSGELGQLGGGTTTSSSTPLAITWP